MPAAKSGKAGKAVKPPGPNKPHEADIADPGQMAKIKQQQRAEQTGKYGEIKATPFKPGKPVAGRAAAPASSAAQPIAPRNGQGPGGPTASQNRQGLGGQTAPQLLPEPETPKTWIEIELVGEDDEPIAGEKYRITLPDGTVDEGTLDTNGWARVQGIDPSTCEISFPDLDRDAWEFIESLGPRGT